MINILNRIPWHMAGFITIHQRHAAYECALKLILCLMNRIGGTGKPSTRLTVTLLNRLVKASMLCPGFSCIQKDNIAAVAGMSPEQESEYNLPRSAGYWNHFYTLGIRPGVAYDVVEFYIALIRASTIRTVELLTLPQRRALYNFAKAINYEDDHFGFFWAEINWPVGKELDNMTLQDASALEWEAIERVINRLSDPGVPHHSYSDIARRCTTMALPY
ncbi:hypothetical protein F5Y15DRAFT_423983 [Xylariaceae sp. FL0016]|nr:hypothetical protein F5Y15DRAFT_423983 [Xylariaceae sp. FL0016]